MAEDLSRRHSKEKPKKKIEVTAIPETITEEEIEVKPPLFSHSDSPRSHVQVIHGEVTQEKGTAVTKVARNITKEITRTPLAPRFHFPFPKTTSSSQPKSFVPATSGEE